MSYAEENELIQSTLPHFSDKLKADDLLKEIEMLQVTLNKSETKVSELKARLALVNQEPQNDRTSFSKSYVYIAITSLTLLLIPFIFQAKLLLKTVELEPNLLIVDCILSTKLILPYKLIVSYALPSVVTTMVVFLLVGFALNKKSKSLAARAIQTSDKVNIALYVLIVLVSTYSMVQTTKNMVHSYDKVVGTCKPSATPLISSKKLNY